MLLPKFSYYFLYFSGGKEYLMRAHFGLPSVESELLEGKPPIQVKFEIPYFTTSGIQVIWFNLFFLQVDSLCTICYKSIRAAIQFQTNLTSFKGSFNSEAFVISPIRWTKLFSWTWNFKNWVILKGSNHVTYREAKFCRYGNFLKFCIVQGL